jgi:hypothetical protein
LGFIVTFEAKANGRFGSQAAVDCDDTRMAASGTNPALRQAIFQNPNSERLLFSIAVVHIDETT